MPEKIAWLSCFRTAWPRLPGLSVRPGGDRRFAGLLLQDGFLSLKGRAVAVEGGLARPWSGEKKPSHRSRHQAVWLGLLGWRANSSVSVAD
jgi:hypothetical protein